MSTGSIDLNTQKSIVSTRYGLIAGISMSAILLLFQLFTGDLNPYLKLIKYLPLFICLGLALVEIKHIIPGEKIFIKGMAHGFKLSAYAGIIVAIVSLLIAFFKPDLRFSIFGVQSKTIAQDVIISAMLAAETFVFGSIISFIILQFLKERVQL